MRWLTNFWRGLRTRNKVWLGGFVALVGLFGFFVFSVEAVHYSESTEFCSSCHDVMEPEIVTHQLSAHAEVSCGSCHVGEGIQHQLYYKVTAVRYLWSLPLEMYERPLASARGSMRSTDEICSTCHSPEHLHPSKLIVDNDYGLDADNSLTRLLLAMKVEADGNELAVRSTGAHWHVDNSVRFIAPDEFRQEIPWVQVEKNGELVEFVDADADPAIWESGDAEIHTMDCIDCHSREGHSVRKPDEALDQAIARDLIPADLPAVKVPGLAALDTRYASDEEALESIITTINDFYQSEYPAVYADRKVDIDRTVAQVQTLYEQTQFPHMNVYWDTYPENTGHKDFPGCFRCHNGSLLNDGGEAIPADCNLCHAIPQVVRPDEPIQLASLSLENAPESHQSTLWLAEHRFQFDATCDDCHTIADPGGSSNTSTCSNSACHDMDWRYLNIDSPTVLAMVVPERRESTRRLPRIPHPVAEGMSCQQCHGPEKVFSVPEDHQDYSQEECSDCHELSEEVLADMPPTPPAPTPLPTAVPMISHVIEGNENCLNCHAVDGNIKPAPSTHSDFTNAVCGDCHRLAPELVPLLNLEPTVEPTTAPPTVPTSEPTIVPTTAPTTAPTLTLEPTSEPTEESTAESEDALPADADADAAGETAAVDNPLAIVSHPIAGNENCVACHAADGDIAPAPFDHVVYTNDTCQECHPGAED